MRRLWLAIAAWAVMSSASAQTPPQGTVGKPGDDRIWSIQGGQRSRPIEVTGSVSACESGWMLVQVWEGGVLLCAREFRVPHL